MLAQDQAKELSFKDFLLAMIEDLTADFSFFPFSFVYLGPGGQYKKSSKLSRNRAWPDRL